MPEIEDRWPSRGLKEFLIIIHHFPFYCASLRLLACHVRTFTLFKKKKKVKDHGVISLEIVQPVNNWDKTS